VTPAVVADADVLFGATTRGLLIHLDYQGLMRLHWSATILEEMSRALVESGRKPDVPAARRHEQLMRASLPHAQIDSLVVDAQFDAVALAVRSKKDVHVAACAHAVLAAGCYPDIQSIVLLTKNIRDFSAPKLAGLSIEVMRPDVFLINLIDRDMDGVVSAFDALRATLRSRPASDALLDRLAADGQSKSAAALRAALKRKPPTP
jgi:hypothetical protein